jgi:hypothetical protein
VTDLAGLCDGCPPVLVCEFNGTSTSPLEQLGQALASGSNCLISQYSSGAKWSQCVVYVICTNGHLYQFAALTLGVRVSQYFLLVGRARCSRHK